MLRLVPLHDVRTNLGLGEFADAAAQQYCGESIPWLVVINDDGKPLTQNGIDKKYISADAVLEATEARLKEIKR